jgi:DNA-directed RNA polymerase subunit RPC12/RpoP
MQRLKLMALPINTASRVPAMQHITKEPSKYGNYQCDIYHYCYTAQVDTSTNEEILILDIYTPKPDSKHIMRMFMDGKKWFSTDGKTGKVSEASLYYNPYKLGFDYWADNYRYKPCSQNDDVVVNRFYKKHKRTSSDISKSGIDLIAKWQQEILNDRLKSKYEKIKESTSREMLEIRELPKAFYDWIVNSVMKDARYLFYDSNGKKQTTAFCSHCGRTVEIDRPHQDDKVKCPNCHSICTCKAKKQFERTKGFNKEKSVAYVQSIKGGKFCTRYFTVLWEFSSRDFYDFSPKKYIFEKMRRFQCIVPAGLCDENIFEKDSNYQGGEWRKVYYADSRFETAHIFPNTLNKILKSTQGFNKYHFDYNLVARKCGRLSLKGLWKTSNEVEFLMNLVMNGLTSLAQSIINLDVTHYNRLSIEEFDTSKGSLRKGCGISKDELPFWQKLNLGIDDYIRVRTIFKTRCVNDVDTVLKLLKIAHRSNLLTATGIYKEVCKYSTPLQFLKYYEKQNISVRPKSAKWYDRNSEADWLSDYKDYLDYARMLEYNLNDKSILFPSNFKAKHDEIYKIVTDKKFSQGELPQIAKQYDKYSELYSFEDEDFIIRPPLRHKEINWEGELLHHCVATYAKKIALGNTIILFIRKRTDPDTPYFTLNLDPETLKIIQCRGLRNCAYPNEVKKFMNKWYKEKVEPLKGETKCQNKKTA